MRIVTFLLAMVAAPVPVSVVTAAHEDRSPVWLFRAVCRQALSAEVLDDRIAIVGTAGPGKILRGEVWSRNCRCAGPRWLACSAYLLPA
jgi:hypothetical protein